MSKKVKTFKIGEYCKGGVLTVEVSGSTATIIGKDWDFSTGSRKSSDQSNAKEFGRWTITHTGEPNSIHFWLHSDFERKCMDVLCDLTTSYYADQVYKWISERIKIPEKVY